MPSFVGQDDIVSAPDGPSWSLPPVAGAQSAVPEGGPPATGGSSRLFWIGGLLMAGGVVLGIALIAVAIASGSRAAGDFGTIGVPGLGTGTLEPGRYVITEADYYSYSSSYSSTPPDLAVFSPSGDEVPVVETAYTWNGDLATFVVSEPGLYEVETEIPRLADDWDVVSAVTVERDPSELSAAWVPWFLGGFFGGGAAVVAGIVVLIVAAVKRSRARPRPQLPQPQPWGAPGWGAPGWGSPGWPPPQGQGWPPPGYSQPGYSQPGYSQPPGQVQPPPGDGPAPPA